MNRFVCTASVVVAFILEYSIKATEAINAIGRIESNV
jgi:hypothetical protein